MRRIADHLKICETCSQAYQALLAEEETPPPDPASFAGIQNAIEEWNTSATARNSPAILKLRTAREIAPFLGRRASFKVLRCVSDTGEDLLSAIEPVLALFLGSRAAGRLVDHVVDTVLIRNRP